MIRIGEFSKLSNISIRMLRHYDELELLVPSQIDDMSGYRYYSANQLEIANKIQRLKELGFSLTIIKEIIYEEDTSGIEHFFDVRKRELEEELSRIKLQNSLLEEAMGIVKEKADIMKYHVSYKKMQPLKIASIRKIVDNFYEESTLWSELYEKLAQQNVKIPADATALAIYHDEEYKDKDVDIEVCITLKDLQEDKDGVTFYTLPEYEVASTTYHGSYEQMPLVTQATAKWIETNGHELSGKMLNIFYVSPAQDKNEENWITEACFEIRKERGGQTDA
ncbi:MerR family transcriptional regulator [Breznakia pachnodae]|uniref:DNA-binding transcriptional MerR regulator n=1 Tax=Breznakia pachnodae TaxID=265178 RepID=A0ABU0E4C3_9FIRM|nr:MerR family transcriptional regulator [Breznakia pachnodae]MDQ0361753.1 DNA-binding transcriptional MerR regulator [Breznakia pachnodae]